MAAGGREYARRMMMGVGIGSAGGGRCSRLMMRQPAGHVLLGAIRRQGRGHGAWPGSDAAPTQGHFTQGHTCSAVAAAHSTRWWGRLERVAHGAGKAARHQKPCPACCTCCWQRSPLYSGVVAHQHQHELRHEHVVLCGTRFAGHGGQRDGGSVADGQLPGRRSWREGLEHESREVMRAAWRSSKARRAHQKSIWPM